MEIFRSPLSNEAFTAHQTDPGKEETGSSLQGCLRKNILEFTIKHYQKRFLIAHKPTNFTQ